MYPTYALNSLPQFKFKLIVNYVINILNKTCIQKKKKEKKKKKKKGGGGGGEEADIFLNLFNIIIPV